MFLSRMTTSKKSNVRKVCITDTRFTERQEAKGGIKNDEHQTQD